MKNKSYSLKEIASWTASDSEVVIPALQRGLVWKPSQVELLWDSILRGFPIGSFMLSDIVEQGQQGKYYLMDGQQRYNAISIGFNTVKDARAVLWIDLVPPLVKNSTRKFWIKATTKPQPWGFKNDDDCTRLNTSEKRQAIDEFELQGNIYNREFSLKETWPIEANCPIPLWCLLDAIEDTRDDENAFCKKTLEIFKSTDFAYSKKIKIEYGDGAYCYLKDTLFPCINSLDKYHVNCNHLPKEVMESETEAVTDTIEQTTLEVLFTRLNTGGTAISRDDLNYSAIKAYWPTIKDINDRLAEKYMSPPKLVMLAFRLALTERNDDSLKNELSIRQIRSYARKEAEREKIPNLYNHHLKDILEQIEIWLGVEGNEPSRTPGVLRTSIARNSPDVYLLLMYFAYENIKSPFEITVSQIRALTFCLHWFTANNEKKACVQEIFRSCKKGITLKNVQKGISRLMYDGKLLYIYNPKDVREFIPNSCENTNWRVWHSVPSPAHKFFNRVFWNGQTEPREMLLYAEREYINTYFANYDPARQDMWAEYNRPWDFDHIVAQDRVLNGYGTRGPYREYDKQWCDSIGNFAAITLESNRSKNNRVDFSEYRNNVETLIYDDAIETLPDRELTYNANASIRFAHITYNRFCKIYEKVYELIEEVVDSVVLSDTLLKRKEIFCEIAGLYPDAIFHFATPEDGNDNLLKREQDWTREWLGVGITRGDFMACVEWPATIDGEKPTEVECGIRKAIGTSVSNEKRSLFSGDDVENDNPWWYKCRVSDSLDLETIKNELDCYLFEIQQVIKSF